MPTIPDRNIDSRSNTPRHSRVGTPDMSAEREGSLGHETDVEDVDATLVKRNLKGKQRTDWLEGQRRVMTEPESMARSQTFSCSQRRMTVFR